MPPIPVPRRTEPPPATPEQLYDRLTVTDSAIGALWRHQSHMLGQYHARASSADIALELPTGAGKTLVGLLIADWRRQTRRRPSAFICPTRQLAQQAHDKARGYGIKTVLLTGGNRGWDPTDRTLGLNGEATIVSVYSHIFNASPKMSPDTLVLDDAHAAEGFVADNWSLEIPRAHPGYEALVAAVGDALTPQVLTDLTDDFLTNRPIPAFVGPEDLASRSADVQGALDPSINQYDDRRFAWRELRAHLAGCVMYLTWGEILLRPFIPPTRFHPAFAEADQRVYLSATLGAAGELERSFGRTSVPRIAMPSEWERHGTGRRLILMPAASMDGRAATAFIKQTLGGLPRALALVPSTAQVDGVRPQLPDGWNVLTTDEVNDRLEPFRNSTDVALVLANRYDGIDLPGEVCQAILINGLPAGTHLQERFLFETADARSALRERMRTRLMQGMGRATRNRSDRAVILLAGQDLLTFLSDPSNISGLRPELQAELRYGIFLGSEGHDLSGAVRSFLEVSSDWQDAEDYLRQEIDNAASEVPDGSAALERAAPEEVLACEAGWRGDYGVAVGHAQAAVRQLAGRSVGAYRTVWKVLAAHWAVEHAQETSEALDARVAAELVRDAAASARVRAWRPRLPQVKVPTDVQALDSRAVRIAERLIQQSKSPKVDRYIDEAVAQLRQTEAGAYERGLLRLGELLGFDAVRPAVSAAPDGAWRDGDDHVLWEAKSEQLLSGAISAKLVREANSHATWVERELDWAEGATVVTFLASPRAEVDREAVSTAATHVELCSLDAVAGLASAAADLWRSLLSRIAGLTPTEVARLAATELGSRGLTSPELSQRLEARPIAGMTPAGPTKEAS